MCSFVAQTFSEQLQYTGLPHFIMLCFTVLHRSILYKLKACDNTVLSKSIAAIFPTAFVYFVSLSHFGNSHNISNFIIIIFVTVINGL